MPRLLPPVHPGEVLLEDCMKPAGLSANRLAGDLKIPASRILEIIAGRRGISADTALRLAAYFGTSPQFWLNVQQGYDLEVAERKDGARIRREVRTPAGVEQAPKREIPVIGPQNGRSVARKRVRREGATPVRRKAVSA